MKWNILYEKLISRYSNSKFFFYVKSNSVNILAHCENKSGRNSVKINWLDFNDLKCQILITLLWSFNFRGRSINFFIIVNIFCHLPHLHDVVFTHRTDHPGIIRVPGEIRNLGCVPTMNEKELWRTIFGILSTLFFANLGEVPNMKAPVCATRC